MSHMSNPIDKDEKLVSIARDIQVLKAQIVKDGTKFPNI